MIQHDQVFNCGEKGKIEENDRPADARQSIGPETQDASDQEEDREEEREDDSELTKHLARQRRRAIQAANGARKISMSRNTYKDKGGRSSHNSKIQKQLSSW
ncbi:unnamed protein product [Ilex paraguariensis]|uniref:Uncharacterized protein n=1 Tax=Ilex paraguariensis TaxID=185542 RepID=A0ABC8UGI5_9AQUA